MTGDVIDPITRQHYERDPRWIAKKAEMYLKNSGVGRHRLLRRRSRVLHLRQHPLRSEPALRLLLHRRRRRPLELRAREGQPGLPAALQGRLLPGAAHRSLSGSARRDGADHDRVRPEHRVPSPRSGHRRPVRDRSAVRHAGEVGRQHDAVQVHHPQRGQPVRQDGDVHAQAAVWRQRQRHAHAPEPVEGRQAAVCGRHVCGPEPDGAVVHRRVAEARAGAVGDHRAHDQQLQAAGAGL